MIVRLALFAVVAVAALWSACTTSPTGRSQLILVSEEQMSELGATAFAQLKAKSKVEVVRRGLRLLKESTDRASLREAYRRASLATRASVVEELESLDHLAAEGLDAP